MERTSLFDPRSYSVVRIVAIDSSGYRMVQEKLLMRKVKRVLSCHFEKERSSRFVYAPLRDGEAFGGADAGPVCGVGPELGAGR